MSMNKEYRAELRDLNLRERVARRQLHEFAKSRQAQLRQMRSDVNRIETSTRKSITIIAKRRAILQGRLAS